MPKGLAKEAVSTSAAVSTTQQAPFGKIRSRLIIKAHGLKRLPAASRMEGSSLMEIGQDSKKYYEIVMGKDDGVGRESKTFLPPVATWLWVLKVQKRYTQSMEDVGDICEKIRRIPREIAARVICRCWSSLYMVVWVLGVDSWSEGTYWTSGTEAVFEARKSEKTKGTAITWPTVANPDENKSKQGGIWLLLYLLSTPDWFDMSTCGTGPFSPIPNLSERKFQIHTWTSRFGIEPAKSSFNILWYAGSKGSKGSAEKKSFGKRIMNLGYKRKIDMVRLIQSWLVGWDSDSRLPDGGNVSARGIIHLEWARNELDLIKV